MPAAGGDEGTGGIQWTSLVAPTVISLQPILLLMLRVIPRWLPLFFWIPVTPVVHAFGGGNWGGEDDGERGVPAFGRGNWGGEDDGVSFDADG